MDRPTRRLRGSTRAFFLPIAAITMIATFDAGTVARAQQPPSPPKSPQPPASSKPQTKKDVVVVRGCVSGATLTHAEAYEYTSSVPETLRTTGSRAVRGALKEADGHTVELTGTLKGLGNQANGVLVKDTGKTKVYVGATERRVGGKAQDRTINEQPVEMPTLDVSSVKDIAPQCKLSPAPGNPAS